MFIYLTFGLYVALGAVVALMRFAFALCCAPIVWPLSLLLRVALIIVRGWKTNELRRRGRHDLADMYAARTRG